MRKGVIFYQDNTTLYVSLMTKVDWIVFIYHIQQILNLLDYYLFQYSQYSLNEKSIPWKIAKVTYSSYLLRKINCSGRVNL